MHRFLTRALAASAAPLLLATGLTTAGVGAAGAARPDGMTLLSAGHQVSYLDHGAWLAKRGGIHSSGLSGSFGSGPLFAHGAEPETELGTPKVYVIFWGSQWGTRGSDANGNDTFSADSSGMAPRLEQLFKGIGGAGETWSGVATQYCDGVSSGTTSCPAGASHVGAPTSSGVLSGVWYDASAPAPVSATTAQIAQEALNGASYFAKTTTDQSAQYVVVSPSGTHPDGFDTTSGGFCAWHSYATSSSGMGFAYTNLPYIPDMGASCGAGYVNAGSAGSLDGVTIVEGHEYAETLTDLNAAGGWLDSSGYETGDKCAWNGAGSSAWNAQDVSFGTGAFAMQATWSNAASGCQISAPYWLNVPSDFSLAATPTTLTVAAGSAASASVSTAITAGNSQSVALSASGLPAGATASFSPSSVTTGSASTLSISTSAATPVGSYAVTLTGSASSGSHSLSITLNVTAAPVSAFSLVLSPTSGTATRGGSSITSSVKTATTSGAAQAISLSVSGAPRGVTTSLSRSSVSSGGSVTLTIRASRTAAAGSYTLVVSGKASSGTVTASYSLTLK